MKTFRPGRPSPALVVATVALIVALGGTAYASLSLPKNSVGSRQLKNGAVKTAKIKNGAVTAAKINTKGLTVPAADSAKTATTAQTADSAQAVAYAHVSFNGTLDTAHSRNVSSSVLTSSTGVYCLHVSVPVVNATGTVDLEAGSPPADVGVVLSSEDPLGRVSEDCPSADNVLVLIAANGGSTEDLSFWVSFN